jgi:Rieske Fe-S protein
LIETGASPWEEAYKPSRKTLTAAGDYLAENKDVVANLVEHVAGRKVKDLAELAPGEGAIAHIKGDNIAAYRDEEGKLHLVSPVCTHVGCVVHFNSFERCWDCPCHGSQFDVDGAVLAGPAKKSLKAIGRNGD